MPEVRFEHSAAQEEQTRRRRRERAVARQLRRLGVVPYGRIAPGAASSIHYAGTLPIREQAVEPFASRADGRLWAAPKVYIGDSAGFRTLQSIGFRWLGYTWKAWRAGRRATRLEAAHWEKLLPLPPNLPIFSRPHRRPRPQPRPQQFRRQSPSHLQPRPHRHR